MDNRPFWYLCLNAFDFPLELKVNEVDVLGNSWKNSFLDSGLYLSCSSLASERELPTEKEQYLGALDCSTNMSTGKKINKITVKRVCMGGGRECTQLVANKEQIIKTVFFLSKNKI